MFKVLVEKNKFEAVFQTKKEAEKWLKEQHANKEFEILDIKEDLADQEAEIEKSKSIAKGQKVVAFILAKLSEELESKDIIKLFKSDKFELILDLLNYGFLSEAKEEIKKTKELEKIVKKLDKKLG